MEAAHELGAAALSHRSKPPKKEVEEMHVKKVKKHGGGHHYHVTMLHSHPEHPAVGPVSHDSLKTVHEAMDEHMGEPGGEEAEEELGG